MKKYFKLTIVLLFLLCNTYNSFAGGMGPGGPDIGPQQGCWPPGNPACVPIDGGITLLIAAGLAYGGKKTMELRKKQEQ